MKNTLSSRLKGIFYALSLSIPVINYRGVYVLFLGLLLSSQLFAQSITIGPSATSTASVTWGPMNCGTTAARYNRTAYIYPSTLFSNITDGDRILALAFRKAVTTAPAGTSNFKMYIKNTSLTTWPGTLTWATEISNATLVFDGSPNTILGNTSGFKTFPFTNAYIFNGANGNNLAVYVEYTQTAASTAITWIYDTQTGVPDYATGSTRYASSTAGSTPAATLTSSNANHPQLRIDYKHNLNTSVELVSPSGACTGSTDSIRIRVNNLGTNAITSLIVDWEFNGVAQTPFNYTGNIPENASRVIAIGSKTFPAAVPINIKAWTSSLNAAVDKFPANDTVNVKMNGPALAGVYTIGGVGADYPDMLTAVNDLNARGVCAPVTFNVDAASGPYIAQLELKNIVGTSAVNKIIFNGNGAVISDTINSAKVNNKHILFLNGTDYTTFDNFTINYEDGSIYCLAVVIGNNANNNTIKNCRINLDANSTSADFSGISFSASSASYLQATSASYNTIENNIIKGGNAGIALAGTTGSQQLMKGNILQNNIIYDPNLYGIYSTATDSTQILANDISKPNRTLFVTSYGMYITGNSQAVSISKNKIHDAYTQVPSSTATFFGINVTANDARAGKEVIIKNNIVYNIKSNGIHYGLHTNNSDSIQYLNNTVHIDNPNATAGNVGGLYSTGAATGVRYLNNNVSITKGGNGNKHGVWINTADVTAMFNYNNIFVDTTVGKTGQRNVGYFVATPFVTLADWKTANTNMWDQNSISARSLFADASNGDLTPNSFDVNNMGTPLAAVTDDINGVTRNATNPDPGAYEFTPILNDAGLNGSTLVNGSCFGLVPVGFRLKNYGANDLTSAQINWSINGVLQTPHSYTGTLGSGADTMVIVGTRTIGLDTAYTINAWTSLPNAVADNRTSNDTLLNINYKAAMSGTYTVGGVGAKYPSITDAANDLNTRGVCGPVIIDVNKNAGPYNEQIKINDLVGTSAINTVVFKGHGVALNFNSTNSAIRYGFYIDGADYVTIDSFIITPVSSATNFGWGIHLGSNSNYNKITNNVINLNNNITSQNFTGITLTGSTTSLNTVGGYFVGNLIENNIINGGVYNINIYGVAGQNSLTRGNRIIGNKMYDPYHYSVSLYNQDSAEVSKNEMTRSTRVTSVNFVGVYLNGVSGSTLIDGNNIHDAFNANPTTTNAPHGVYFTNCPHSAGREALVKNNVIHNFYGNGAHYGLYAGGTSSYIRFYNNTINLDNKTQTAGSAYGFYQTGTTTNIDVKNNIFVIAKGGTTAKYGIYLGTLPPGVTSDYNNIFVSGTGNNVGYYSSARATLTIWKTVNTNAYDQNSVSVDPEFLNPSQNNFKPNSPALNNTATPIAAVNNDYTGAVRSGTPDIGAYEFVPTVNDAEVVEIVGPSIVCVSSNVVDVKIKNRGTANLSALTLNWSINNVLQTPFVFNGTLPRLKDSVISIGVFNGIANSTYAIKVWSSLPNNLADENVINDTVLKQNIKTGMAGMYTIGNTPSTYSNFNAAINDLTSRGLCGPVTLNVIEADGPYEEKVTITPIPGASSINTLTIKGNNALLHTLITATGDRAVLTLNGADYVTIDSLMVEVKEGSDYGYAVLLTNAADYNTIKNSSLSTIDTSSSSFASLVFGGLSSISTASNSKYNTIENNTIFGGYYGLTIYGTSSNNQLTRANIIRNNKIQDFYYYGLYHYYADSTQLIGNDISRPTATLISSTTYATYILGASQNLTIERNRIHNMYDQDQSGTGTLYGYYLSTGAAQTGKQTIVSNNLIYNINNSGTTYGIYNSTSGNVLYYHNTILLDNQNATAGTAYGFFQTGNTTGIEFKNNNLVVSKTGSGTKYGIYMSTAATPLTTDYNNIYVPNGNVGYNSSARLTLADWQLVNPAFDVNSVSTNPIFPNRVLEDFTPASALINNLGTPIALVPTDFKGVLRNSATPDMGAYEFTPVSEDAAITAFDVQSICVGVQPIAVRLRSLGTNTLSSVTINWTVNGIAQTPFSYTGSLGTGLDTSVVIGNTNFIVGNIYNFKIWTSLPNGTTDLNNLNDTLLANNKRTGLRGVYTIGGSGANYASLSAAATDLNNLGVCGNVSFNVNPAAGPYNEQVLLESIAGASDTSKIVFNGNGAVVTFTATASGARHLIKLRGADYVTIDSFRLEMNPSSTYGFPVHILSGSNNNTIKRNYVKTIENSSSSNFGGIILSGSETSATGAGSNISFNTIENNTIVNGYYTMTIAGTSASATNQKGNVIRNNKIIDSYIYSIYTVGCDSTTISGNEIYRANRTTQSTFYGVYNTTNSFRLLIEKNKIHDPFPMLLTSTSAFYGIYTNASDGLTDPSIIKNNVIYNVNSNGTQYGLTNLSSDNVYYYNNTIVLSDTAQSTAVVNGFLQSGSTASTGLKIKNNNFFISRPGSANRIGLYFTAPTTTFEADYNNFYITNGTGINAVAFLTNNYNTLVDWKASNNNAYDQNSIETNPLFNLASSGIYRPFSGGLDNKGTPLLEVPTDIMDSIRNSTTPDIGAYEFTAVGEDAGIGSLAFTSVCAGVNPVSVNLVNSSANVLSTVTIAWSVNGIAQPNFNFVGALSSASSTSVTLGNYNFLQGISYTLKFWTSQPNGLADANNTNDTLTVTNFTTALLGTYTIGGVGANYANLIDAVAALNSGGVCGPVVFNMNPAAGPYTGQVEIGNINGASSTNTVTINGRGSVITANISDAAKRGLIRLNGTKYLTLDSVTVNVDAASVAGYALLIGSNANNNTIKNSSFNSVAQSTSTSFGAIIFSGAENSATIGSNSSYNTIENNSVSGGYYAISVYGTSGGNSLTKANIIKNNRVKDFYAYGIYNIYADSTQISSNDVSRPNQTASTTTYGIYFSGVSQDVLVEKNRIHNLFDQLTTNSSTMYGIGFATGAAQTGKMSVVKNNLVYNNANNGTHYGLYNSTSGNVVFYNNTVAENSTLSTAGATYGIYQTGSTTGIEYKNNNIFVTRTGSGVKYGIYMATAASPITSNYNNFYVPNGSVGYNAAAHATLADWKLVLSGAFDANSESVNPVFTYANVGNYAPTTAALDNKGLSISMVVDDINSALRDVNTPDIGAYEFTPPVNEIGVTEILYPTATNKCGLPNDSVVVVIQNSGSAVQSGFNIKLNVTGVSTAAITNAYVGSLASGALDTITFKPYNTDLSGVINLTVNTDLATDAYKANDTARFSFTTSQASPIPTAANATVCVGSQATLVASGANNIYRWYDAPVGGNLLTKNDTLITPVINGTTKFYVSGTSGSSNAFSVGPLNVSIGTNGNFTNPSVQYLEFDALSTFTLDSVSIYPNGPGNVEVRLLSSTGTVLQTRIVAVSTSQVMTRIPVGFVIQPGTAYRMDGGPGTTTGGLWRNSAGGVYPYTVPGIVSITGNSFSTTAYYYYYNWRVTGGAETCPSPRKEVVVNTAPTVAGTNYTQGATYQGIFNAGTSVNPDRACAADTLEYNITTPNGFTLAGLGTTWSILDASVKTTNNTNAAGTLTLTGNTLRFIPATADVDSNLILSVRVKDLSATVCDTTFSRNINIGSSTAFTLGADTTICFGNSITLDAGIAGQTYVWSTGATTQSINVTNSGTYSVTVTNISGCTSTDQIVVNVTPQINIELGADTSICAGSSIIIDAGTIAGATYAWNTGATTQSITASTAGVYFVTVSVGNCIAEDSVMVSINALPVVNLGTDQSICEGDSIILDAGNIGATYVWSTGATTQTIKVKTAATYSVTVTNANGCIATDAVVVTFKAATIADFTSNAINGLNWQFNGAAAPGHTYSWNFGDPTSPSNTSQTQNPIHLFTAIGNYTVTLTTVNVATGCAKTISKVVAVTSVGINNEQFNTVFFAAPNPFKGSTQLNYELTQPATVSLEVYDMLGRLVSNVVSNETQATGKYNYEFNELNNADAAGVYQVRLTVNGQSKVIRIIKAD